MLHFHFSFDPIARDFGNRGGGGGGGNNFSGPRRDQGPMRGGGDRGGDRNRPY